ncbi:MAG: hypothetical protein HC905_30995 [Bacteroidales bacterium]|nr:hypothetical protein [Bacteroidales bacterium]
MEENAPVAKAERDKLVHEFFHAFYKLPDLYSKVQRIAQGDSNADMVQDLIDLAVLGKSNPAPLQAINFDMTRLDNAETLSAEMAKLLAQCNGERNTGSAAYKIRNKAYLYMKMAVDENTPEWKIQVQYRR